MWKSFIASVSVIGILSCSGPTEPPPISSISITASSTTIASGATLQLTAATLGKDGKEIANRVVAWSSSNANIANVSATGLLTAGYVLGGTNESVTITAAAEGISGTVAVNVTPSPVATVSLTRATETIGVGATLQLTATLKDVGGNTLTGRIINWTATDTTVLLVSTSGLVSTKSYLGGATRTSTVTATSESQTASTNVSVTPIPVETITISPTEATLLVRESKQLSIEWRDRNGNTLSNRQTAWSTSDTSIASVNQTGILYGKKAGRVTINASSSGKVGIANATILNPTPGTLTITTSQLPSESLVSFEITDADGLVQTRQSTASTPLIVSGLLPGQLSVRAAQAGSSTNAIPFRHNAAANPRTIQMPNAGNEAITFEYILSSGAVQLTTTGVPIGFAHKCELWYQGGSSSFYAGLNQDVATAPAGPAQLRCLELYDNNLKVWYDATPATQAITVQASTTPIQATVVYSRRP